MNIQVRVIQGPGATAALRQMEAQMGRVGAATAGAAVAGNRLSRWMGSGHLERWGKNLQWTGRQIEYSFTLPLLLAGGAATKWALDNERAMTRIRKVYGDAGMSTAQMTKETNELGEAFRLLSDKFGIVQAEVIGVGALWAQIGAEGVAVARATQATLELMILGEMEAVQATEALIAVQAQYGLSTLELRDAVGQLNAIENATATRLEDLILVIQRAGGSARNAGVDIRHLSAMTASLVPVTGKAQRAGNALRTMIDRLMVPTRAALDVMREMGLEVDESSWHSKNFTERLTEVAKAMENLSTAGVAHANSVISSRWNVARFSTLLKDFVNPAGRYAKALEVTSDATQNLGEQSEYMLEYQKELAIYLASNPQLLSIMTQRLKNMMSEAIAPMIPAFLGLFQRILQLVRAFTNLEPQTQQLILAFLLFIAVTGPIIRYVGALTLLVTRLNPVLKFFYHRVQNAAAILMGLGKALLFVVNPTTWARLFTLLRTPFSAIAAGFGVVWRGIVVGSAATLRALTLLHSGVMTVVAAVPGMATTLVAGFSRAYAMLTGAMGAITRGVGTALMASVALFQRAIVAMTVAWTVGWQAIHATTTFFLPLLMRGIGLWASGVVGLVGQAVVGIMQAFVLLGAQLPVILARTGVVISSFFNGLVLIIQNFGRLWPFISAQITAGLMAVNRVIIGFVTPMYLAMGRVMTAVHLATIAGMAKLRTITMAGAAGVMAGVTWLGTMWLSAFSKMWGLAATVFRVGWTSLLWISTVGVAKIGSVLATLPSLLAGIGPALVKMGAALRVGLGWMALAWSATWAGMMATARALIAGLTGFFGANLTRMVAMTFTAMRTIALFLLGWPGLIIAAVAAVAYVLREDIGRAIDWLGRAFTSLPRVAHSSLMKVVEVFKSAARAVWELIRFIFNPFAAMNKSQSSAPAATPGALERQSGGVVPGQGRGDKVPALLESGEFVVRRTAVERYGVDRMQALNEGLVQRFARGGLVQQETPAMIEFDRKTAGARGAIEAKERAEQRTVVVAASPDAGPAFDAMVASLGRLNSELESLRAAYRAQAAVVNQYQGSLDAANRELEAAEKVLKRVKDAADAAKDSLQAAESVLNDLVRTPITGMGEMADSIFENEMAQKGLRLEMLRIEEAIGPIEDVRSRLSALQADIEKLRAEREDLRLAGAGSSILGTLDEQISEMEKARKSLESGAAVAQFEELEKQLGALEIQGQILSLEQSLTFDPMTRQLEQLTNTMQEVPFDQLLASAKAQQEEVARLRSEWQQAEAAMQGPQATVDALRARRDAILEVYDPEKAKLDEIADRYGVIEEQISNMESAMGGFAQKAESASPNLEAFANAMQGESFDIPGGDVGTLGMEEGSTQEFIDNLMKDLEVEMDFPNPFEGLQAKFMEGLDKVRANMPAVIGTFGGAIAGHIAGGSLGAKVGGALGTALGPLGTVVGGLLGAAFGAGISWLISNLDLSGITDWLATSPLGRLWETLGGPIMDFVNMVKEWWGNLTAMLKEEFAKWEDTFAAGKEAFDQVMQWLGVAWEFILSLFGEGTYLREAWTATWQAITDVLGPVLTAITGVLQGVFQVIRNVFNLIFAIINGEWGVAWQAVQDIFGGVWNAIFAILQGAIGVLIGIGTAIFDTITAPFRAIWDWLVGNSLIPDLINAIVEWFLNLVAWIVAPLAALWEIIKSKFAAIRDFVAAVWDAVWTKISTVVDSISTKVKSVVGTLKTWWDRIFNGISATITTVMDKILTKVETVTGAMRRAFRSTRNAIGNAVDGIKKRLQTPLNWVINTAYNNGIRKFWNMIASKIGMPELEAIEPLELNKGGRVPGVGNRDTVPAMLTPGEFVLNQDAAKNLGPEVLAKINNINFTDHLAALRSDPNAKGGTGYAVGRSAPLPEHLAATSTIGPLWDFFKNVPGTKFGNGYRVGSTTYHGKGQAIDVTGDYDALYRAARDRAVWGRLKEYIAPAPYWKLGQRTVKPYPGRLYDTHVAANRHAHIAATPESWGSTGPGYGLDAGAPEGGTLQAFREVWGMLTGIQGSSDEVMHMARSAAVTVGRNAVGFALEKVPFGETIRKAIGFYNGGIVSGSRNGTLVRVGEQYQDEKIIPVGKHGRDDGGGTTNNFYGNLEFPNIRSGADAEAFLNHLETLVD